MDERLKVYDSKMTKSFDALLRDYAAIRAGRANPHVLDKIKVDYYGTPTPLQQVGNISVPEARIIQIQPWEKKLIREIEKAIMTSDLGINPTNDGTCINIRRDANEAFKKMNKNNELTEDDQKDLESQAQKMTDKYISDIDKAVEEKTKEIMTV